ncbi:60S ribosomal protein L4 [Diplocarpon rosae]|nr:60S ribosomal protein L4 [Diplocarpon rosae]
MASKSLQGFSRSFRSLRALSSGASDLLACLAPRLSRSMATETTMPSNITQEYNPSFLQTASDPVYSFPDPTVLATIYKFPTMEPVRFETYDSKHLYLPLRRDILHRAVIYEGDSTRQGTASSKTRYEVNGSHRKVRRQKGSGHARLGTRQSPLLVGGGKTFGPHPRDFATSLPRKMYDLAWRTALSWRYRRGELIICNRLEIRETEPRYLKAIFKHNHWAKPDGKTLVITHLPRGNLVKSFAHSGDIGRIQTVDDVDVKDLLELGRVVIEKSALDLILSEHQSDLVNRRTVT